MWCLFSDIFCLVGMTTWFNENSYVEIKQKEGEEAQPGGSLQSKRRRLKKGSDSEKSSVPSTIQEVSEAPSSSLTILLKNSLLLFDPSNVKIRESQFLTSGMTMV